MAVVIPGKQSFQLEAAMLQLQLQLFPKLHAEALPTLCWAERGQWKGNCPRTKPHSQRVEPRNPGHDLTLEPLSRVHQPIEKVSTAASEIEILSLTK